MYEALDIFDAQPGPRSEAADIAITGISSCLCPERSGLNQNVCCAPHLDTFSYSDLHDTFIEIAEVRVQLPEGRVTNAALVCMAVTGVEKRLHLVPSRPSLGESQGFS